MAGTKYRHPWGAYQRRFFYEDRWPTLALMAEALKVECAAKGMPSPSFTLIRQRAGKEGWHEQRAQIEQQARAQDAALFLAQRRQSALDVFAKHEKIGAGLVNLGLKWIADREREAAAAAKLAKKKGKKSTVPGVITTAYEAAGFLRLGAILEKTGAQAALQAATLTPVPPANPNNPEEAPDELNTGIVELPPQQQDAEWQAKRRKSLGPPEEK